jgi:chromate transporter
MMTDLTAKRKAKPDLPAHGISFREALVVWVRVAILSFGGPAGQIAVMHRIIVEEKHWISESRFPARAELLHAAARPRGAAVCDLYGWLLTSHGRRPAAGGCSSCPASSPSWR